jgi:hypothetical protein
MAVSDLLSAMNQRVFWSSNSPGWLGLSPATELGSAVLLVLLAFVWRRISLRRGLDGVRRVPRVSGDVRRLVIGLIVVLGTTIPVWCFTVRTFSFDYPPPPGYAEQPAWWLTRPGFLVLILILLHGAALTGLLGRVD